MLAFAQRLVDVRMMGNFAFVEYDHPLDAEDAVRVRIDALQYVDVPKAFQLLNLTLFVSLTKPLLANRTWMAECSSASVCSWSRPSVLPLDLRVVLRGAPRGPLLVFGEVGTASF